MQLIIIIMFGFILFYFTYTIQYEYIYLKKTFIYTNECKLHTFCLTQIFYFINESLQGIWHTNPVT